MVPDRNVYVKKFKKMQTNVYNANNVQFYVLLYNVEAWPRTMSNNLTKEITYDDYFLFLKGPPYVCSEPISPVERIVSSTIVNIDID